MSLDYQSKMATMIDSLKNNLDQLVQNFIKEVADKYSLSQDELMDVWFKPGQSKPGKPSPRSTSSSTKPKLETIDLEDISLERLHKCTKPELVALCKAKGQKTTGTKEVLIDRLRSCQSNGSATDPKPKETSQQSLKSAFQKSDNKESKVEKKEKPTQSKPPIVKKLMAEIPVIPIRRNTFGNLEHSETGLIFDRVTETVIGKQQTDGKIKELTEEDIELCKKYKFKYTIPQNLDKDNLDNVKIQELDSDSEIEVMEDEVEEVDAVGSEEDVELLEDEEDEL